MRALDAARGAGASYADVRVSRNRNQSISTRERQITGFEDAETFGFGVRVLANGAWGFAASKDLTLDEADRVARQAVAQARANAAARTRPVELAPVEPVPDGRWSSPVEIDPFERGHRGQGGAAAARQRGARWPCRARASSPRPCSLPSEEKTFASTDGSYTVQTLFRSYPQMTVTAVEPAAATSRPASPLPCSPWGWATSTCATPTWWATRQAGRRTRWPS